MGLSGVLVVLLGLLLLPLLFEIDVAAAVVHPFGFVVTLNPTRLKPNFAGACGNCPWLTGSENDIFRGARMRGTLGDIDPLNKVPFNRARSRVKNWRSFMSGAQPKGNIGC